MTEGRWTAKYQALIATRDITQPLDERAARAMQIAEVAAAWMDRLEAGEELTDEARDAIEQVGIAGDALEQILSARSKSVQ